MERPSSGDGIINKEAEFGLGKHNRAQATASGSLGAATAIAYNIFQNSRILIKVFPVLLCMPLATACFLFSKEGGSLVNVMVIYRTLTTE